MLDKKRRTPRRSAAGTHVSEAIQTKEDLAKLHCVHHLFAQATGEDPYLLKNLKEAIDQALSETTPENEGASLETFADAALKLFQQQPFLDASYGFFHLDLRRTGFEPLFVREALIAGLKRISGYQRSLVVVTGLRGSLCPPGHYFTERVRARHDEAIAYMDELASRWTTRNTQLTILYF